MSLKNVERQENNMVKLTLEFSAEDFDAAVEKVYRKNKNQIYIAGFRKGKAPRKLIEKMYGADLFYEEAINDIYPDALDEAIKEEDIAVASYPKMNVVSAGPDGLVLTAELAEKPEITVENYKGIVAPYPEVEVTEKDIELAMTPYVSRAKTAVEAGRPAEFNDTVNIDFIGYKDGEPFPGGSGQDFDLVLGSLSFIPGFEEELIGVSAGEEKVFNITFPEDYSSKDLAGQEVQFKVHMNSVKYVKKPELDDEFAKDVSEFETLDELKEFLSKQCRDDKEADAQKDFERAVMDQLIKETEIDVPEAMIEYERDRLVDNYNGQLMGNGMSLDQYVKIMGTTMDEFKEGLRDEAIHVIKNELILEAIIRQESIEVNDEDIDKYAEKTGKLYGMTAEEMKSALPAESLEIGARMDKAAQVVYDSAVRGPAPEKEAAPEGEAAPEEAE